MIKDLGRIMIYRTALWGKAEGGRIRRKCRTRVQQGEKNAGETHHPGYDDPRGKLLPRIYLKDRLVWGKKKELRNKKNYGRGETRHLRGQAGGRNWVNHTA